MNFVILLMGVALEAALGHPREPMRLKFYFAWALRTVRGWQMRRESESPGLREGLTFLGMLLMAMGLCAALTLPLPWLGVICLYLAMDARTLTQRAMQVRRHLDDGHLAEARGALSQLIDPGEAEGYEGVVRRALIGLAQSFTYAVALPVVLALIGLPWGLGPALVWGAVMLGELARYNNPQAQSLRAWLGRILMPVTGLMLALCSGLVGLRMKRALAAFRRAPGRPGHVMLAALGVEEGQRDMLVSGDITQACVLCWLALAAILAVGAILFAALGWLM